MRVQIPPLERSLIQYFLLGGLGLTGAAATPFGRISALDQNTKGYSGFVDTTYHLTSTLSLSAGVRYSNITKNAGQELFAVSVIPGIGLNTSRSQLETALSTTLQPLLAPVLGSTAHTGERHALAEAQGPVAANAACSLCA